MFVRNEYSRAVMVAMLSKALRYLELHTELFSAISINYRLWRNPVAGAGRPSSLPMGRFAATCPCQIFDALRRMILIEVID